MTSDGNQGPLFQRSGFSVYKAVGSEKEYILGPEQQEFRLPSPGIYALRGANQAGKTVLIKALLGVLPPALREVGGITSALVSGSSVSIRNTADAKKHGLVGVFNDDQLVSSMTVFMQMKMRHASPGARAWLDLLLEAGKLKVEHTVGESSFLFQHVVSSFNTKNSIRRLSEWVSRGGGDQKPEYLEEIATKLIGSFNPAFVEILHKYPYEISTGAKAVARITMAMMSPNIRVLFLDEALGSVEAKTWPIIVDSVKQWQEENKTGVVVVSHNNEELIRWNPCREFMIEDKKLHIVDKTGYTSIAPVIPPRFDRTLIFEDKYPNNIFELTRDRKPPDVCIVYDAPLEGTDALRALIDFFKETAKSPPRFIKCTTSEKNKSFAGYKALSKQVIESGVQPTTLVAIVGGGVLLNLGLHAVGTVHRGRCPIVLVPTTVMSIADVALGSKSALNFTDTSLFLKHAVGLYHNPTAIVLLRRFLDTLPANQCKLGLAECVKHGILQDEVLFDDCLHLLNGEPNRTELFEVALRTMKLKKGVLSNDPFEEGFGRVLRFGHLYAHALEMASGFTISHGSCLYWGLLVELYASTQTERAIFDKLLREIQTHLHDEVSRWGSVSLSALQTAFVVSKSHEVHQYAALVVPQIGCYRRSSATLQGLIVDNFDWNQCSHAIRSVDVALNLSRSA